MYSYLELVEAWGAIMDNPLALMVVAIATGLTIGNVSFIIFGNRIKGAQIPLVVEKDGGSVSESTPGAKSAAGSVTASKNAFKQPVDLDVDYSIRNNYSLLDGSCKMVLCVNMGLKMGVVGALLGPLLAVA